MIFHDLAALSQALLYTLCLQRYVPSMPVHAAVSLLMQLYCLVYPNNFYLSFRSQHGSFSLLKFPLASFLLLYTLRISPHEKWLLLSPFFAPLLFRSISTFF